MVDHAVGDSAPAERPTRSRADRVLAAVGWSAAIWVGLIVLGAIIERLRPDELSDRSFLSTPLLWAAALWTTVLVFHASAFETSQSRHLGRLPLGIAGSIGALTFTIGMRAHRGVGDYATRVLYLAANAFGTVAFWSAITALVTLFVLVQSRDRPMLVAGD